SSHILMDRGDPVMQALNDAASTAGTRLPGDVWHVVLFYTTGEAVRHIFEEGGTPGYVPMLYGIFTRGSWTTYRSALETEWRPYVDGKRTLPEASAALVDALRKSDAAKPDGPAPGAK